MLKPFPPRSPTSMVTVHQVLANEIGTPPALDRHAGDLLAVMAYAPEERAQALTRPMVAGRPRRSILMGVGWEDRECGRRRQVGVEYIMWGRGKEVFVHSAPDYSLT